MRVLIVSCHPRVDSFCAGLRDAVVSSLQSWGHAVDLLDLYAEGFNPVLSAEERGRYHMEGDNLGGIEDHIARLRAA